MPGPVGATGIEAEIDPDGKVTVDATQPGTPADGKFSQGDVLTGVNGAELTGKRLDLMMILGKALNEAEATNGILAFDVRTAQGESRRVNVSIPVLGAYSPTFPLDCEKSRMIIARAAEFYAGADRLKTHDLWSALECLFLLSTGDDWYVPRVKEYFAQFLDENGAVKGLADHSWFNGYNGIAVAEYYLRTGDRSVLPILQHYCNDAAERQAYGVGWGHWGYSVRPDYEAGGGMMHSAGNQMLLTLMLGKMCGVEVNDETLLGALTHWYRFAGRGAIPVSDMRPWFILRSAGRDGATAALMHIAAGARGDVSIYREARDYLVLSSVTSRPEISHNWEVYWHSLVDHFMLDIEPRRYHEAMQRQRWRYDLGRQASGAFAALPETDRIDYASAGISLALAFTAPLRNLQITGAPRSAYAQEFILPERLWGTEADRAFLSARHHPDFHKYGEEEDIDVTRQQLPLGLRYSPGDVKNLPLDGLLRDVRHARCEIRMAAAKALRANGRMAELEALLRDPDPRLRRAALDGINDYHAWFLEPAIGRHALKAEAFTPAMCEAISAMLTDPDEAWYVVDGALTALNNAPIETIEKNLPNILRWATHEDWWLRESAFFALMGFRNDEERFLEHLPTLITMMIREYPYNPRHKMKKQLETALAQWKTDSRVGRVIVDGLTRAALESEVLPDLGPYQRSREGAANVIEAALAAIRQAPEAAPDLAEVLAGSGRLGAMETGILMDIVNSVDKEGGYRPIGLYPALKTLPEPQKGQLEKTLFSAFRPELIRRFNTIDEGTLSRYLDMIVVLTRLGKETAGWQDIGVPGRADRVWRYRSFDPQKEEEKLDPRIGPPNRLRKVTLPAGMDGWFRPGFDDRSWTSGRTPIGVGVYTAHGHGRAWTPTPDHSFENNAAWGDGEFLAMRTTFDVADTDFDYYRIKILADQGYDIYLNGEKIHSFSWFQHVPNYRSILLRGKEAANLTVGANTLAVYGNVRYERNKSTGEFQPVGQLDIYLEGLRKKDVGLE